MSRCQIKYKKLEIINQIYNRKKRKEKGCDEREYVQRM